MNKRHIALAAAGLVAASWLAGLFFFVGEVATAGDAPDAQPTDAIVVLTGGSERVAAGIALLDAGKAKKLFISGVHPGLTLDRLLGSQPVSKTMRDCCIVLGHMAETTFGNAAETRAWIEEQHYRSLRLVTANYHMPRSLLIFRALLPGVEIVPHAIAPDSVRLDGWWQRPGTASLLVTEYVKYLLAAARLTFGGA